MMSAEMKGRSNKTESCSNISLKEIANVLPSNTFVTPVK
jgi:hypothetical protein